MPGSFILVDHSLNRTFNKGSLGILQVSGDAQPDVFSGQQIDRVYQAQPLNKPVVPKTVTPPDQKLMSAGQNLYVANCSACHQTDGAGMKGVFPPLAKSDFLMADKERSIGVVLKGHSGKIQVNGQSYDGQMPSMSHLSDEQVANVLTFIRNSWGNQGEAVTTAEVKKVRSQLK